LAGPEVGPGFIFGRMRWFLPFLLSWPVLVFAQQRISFDLNSNLENLNYSLAYGRQLANGFGFSGGIAGGGIVWATVVPPVSQQSEEFRSPHAEMNPPDDSLYVLGGYYTKIKGLGISASADKIWQLNQVHSLRIGVRAFFYRINERIYASYLSQSVANESFGMRYKLQSFSLALGPELFHNIRISNGFSTFYGLKLPWFFPLHTKSYDPSLNSPLKGLRWFLSLGIAVDIG
jgi:hypothetical protein